ncbi:MAG: methyl-accepting chemotaxis protein [Sporomusaceae bacterium]|nr:methyl-accepting chemotaxis protein [Sporomusaceae bacterium]
MTKLEAAIKSAEMFRDLNAFDCSAIVTDAQGIILYHTQAKTFKENVVIGQPAPGGAAKKVIETRQPVRVDVPESAYGVKLRAIMRPIFEDDGTFSGVIGNAINMQTVSTLHEAAQNIASISEEMTATSQELAVTATQLAESLVSVRSVSENVLGEIEKTGSILQFVSDVAQNSNLLGLNAAIEAARAGELGRGFAVVADEMRKMASNSGESVRNIKTILDSIQRQTETVVANIADAAQLGERQAAATEEISATMQQLSSTASEVERFAASI